MFMIFRIKPGHYIPHVVYYWHMDLLFTVNHYAYKNTHNSTHKCLREFYYRKFFRFRIIFWYGEFRTPQGAKSMNQSSQYELVWICIILKWIKMHKIHQIIPRYFLSSFGLFLHCMSSKLDPHYSYVKMRSCRYIEL